MPPQTQAQNKLSHLKHLKHLKKINKMKKKMKNNKIHNLPITWTQVIKQTYNYINFSMIT